VPVVVEDCVEEALRTAKPIRIFSCIDRGWQLAKTDYWAMFGAAALVVICTTAVGLVPRIGSILQILFAGIFNGGVFYYFIGKKRGEIRHLGDAFSGFRRMTSNLIFGSFVCGLLAFLAMLPGLILMGGAAFAIAGATTSAAGISPSPEVPMSLENLRSLVPVAFASLTVVSAVAVVLGALLAICASVYFSVAWMFTLGLIIDRRIKFGAAMTISRRVVSRQWWRLFGLSIVTGLLTFAGCLFCCIGLFFVLPVVEAAMVYAYDDLFSGMRTEKDRGSSAPVELQ
jgi:hypothetical protein